MTKQLTSSEQFNPTPAMRVWLDTAVETMSDNISEIADKCKVTRQSWYSWLKEPEFVSWYHKEWTTRLRSNLWKLDAIGFKKAKEEFRFWEAMQKKLGGFDSYKLHINSEPVIYSWKLPETTQNCEENDS